MTSEIDLDQTKLKKGFRGYEPQQVDRMLQSAADTVDQLLAENARLEEQVERQRSEIDTLRRQDRFVQEALVAAQRAADDIRADAQKQAGAILAEARRTAGDEALLAQKTVQELTQDIQLLQAERKRYIDDFRLILAQHHRSLNIIAYGPDASDEPDSA